MKKIVKFFFVLVLLIPIQTQAKVPKFEKSDTYIAVGQTMKLNILNTNSKVKWAVSNKNVTITKKGKKYVKIKGKKQGTVYVKAKIGKKTYTKKLKVFKPSLNETSKDVFIGDEIYLDLYGKEGKYFQIYSVLPIKWKSSDSDIVVVNNDGLCQVVGLGKCTVTATLYGKKYTCTFDSKETYVTKDAKSKTSIEKKDVGTGYLVKIVNNYKYQSGYSMTYRFKKNGKTVYDGTAYFHIDAGSMIYWNVSNLNDDYDRFAYDDIDISFDPEYDEYYQPIEKFVSIEKQYGNDEVFAICKNPATKELYLTLNFVFYKDGKIVSVSTSSANIKANNKGIIKTEYPYNPSTYEDIDFDDFDVFIEQAYIDK